MRRVLTRIAGSLVLTTAVAGAQMFVAQEVVVNPFNDNGTVTWHKTSDARSPSGYRDYAKDEYGIALTVSGAFVERFLVRTPLPDVWTEHSLEDLWEKNTSPPGQDNPETFGAAFKVPITHGGQTITSRYKSARHSMWPSVEFRAWYDVAFRNLAPGEYTFGATPVTEYHGSTAAAGKKYDYYYRYVVVTAASNTPGGRSERYRVFRQPPFTLRLEPQTTYGVYYVYTTAQK